MWARDAIEQTSYDRWFHADPPHAPLFEQCAHGSHTGEVSVVLPPAVDTNLVRNGVACDETQRRRELDFVARNGMCVERVARRIIEGMMKGKFRIRIGATARCLDVMCRYFPTATHTLLARHKSRIDFL